MLLFNEWGNENDYELDAEKLQNYDLEYMYTEKLATPRDDTDYVEVSENIIIDPLLQQIYARSNILITYDRLPVKIPSEGITVPRKKSKVCINP